jgi:hypothetical protein
MIHAVSLLLILLAVRSVIATPAPVTTPAATLDKRWSELDCIDFDSCGYDCDQFGSDGMSPKVSLEGHAPKRLLDRLGRNIFNFPTRLTISTTINVLTL